MIIIIITGIGLCIKKIKVLFRSKIKCRLKAGNSCYYSIQTLLSSRLLSKNLKIKIYKTIILPVVLYGCETWSLTLREERKSTWEEYSLSLAESIQLLGLIPISFESILVLSSHLFRRLPRALFPVGFLKALLPYSVLATWPAHLNFLDLITLTILGERYKLWSSSLWSLLHSPISSLLGPKNRLRILFSNTLSLHSSLKARDHASHPYSTTSNIIVFYILIFKLVERSRENKSVCNE